MKAWALMRDQEGFSLAPRDVIWPVAFALCQALIALSLGAFTPGSGIAVSGVIELAPLILLGAVAFGGFDALSLVLSGRSRTDALTVLGIDLAVWLGAVALLVVADSGELIWWRFVIPVLVGAAGASILDQGRGRGVMISACVIVLAALGTHATGTGLDWTGLPPALAWPFFAVVGTFPFCAYLRLTHRRGTGLHVAGSITSAVLAIALAFSATWLLAVRSPAARSSEVMLQRQRTASAISDDLGQRFSAAKIAGRAPDLAQALANYSNASGADFYVLESTGSQPVLLLASRNIRGADGSLHNEVTGQQGHLDAAELRAVLAAAGSAGQTSVGLANVGFANLGDTSPHEPSPDWRYAGGPPLAERINVARASAGSQPVPQVTYLLVAAAGTSQWWRALSPAEVAGASVGSVFPWLFYALLLPVMALLLFVSKRRDMRTMLIEAEERSRIRLDTHDKVSNRLSAVAKRIEVTSKMKSGPEEADLQSAAQDIRSALAELLMIVGDGPPSPPAGGVLAQLEQVCASQARQRGMAVTFSAPDDLADLPVKLKWDLQCIVEEALTNASKHGHARHADVTVEVKLLARGGRSALALVVSDDGSGIDQAAITDEMGEEHHGLRGIRRRAAAWKGSARLASEHGRTVLSVEIPVP